MLAEAGELLTVAEHLDGVVLDLAGLGVGAFQFEPDLLERCIGAADNRALGLATKADHDPTTGAQPFVDQVGDSLRRIGVAEDVDVESRIVPGQ